jgi:hypothetical protein
MLYDLQEQRTAEAYEAWKLEHDETLMVDVIESQQVNVFEAPIITEEELDAYLKTRYREMRQARYLPIAEYIDAKTKQSSSDPIIQKAGVDQEENYHAHNLAVKMEFPK